MEHMHNKEYVGKKHLSEEKRVSFKDGTQMNGTDKPDRWMSSPQMFTISILINRLNWCIAGANSTCLTGTSAPAGPLLFIRSQLIVDGFYSISPACTEKEAVRHTDVEQHHSERLRATISASKCIHSSQQHEAEWFKYIALPVAASQCTGNTKLWESSAFLYVI